MAVGLLDRYKITRMAEGLILDETLWVLPVGEEEGEQEVFVVTQEWTNPAEARQGSRLFVVGREDLQPGGEFAEISQHFLADEEFQSSDLCRLTELLRLHDPITLRALEKGQRARFEIAVPARVYRGQAVAERIAEILPENEWDCTLLGTDRGYFIYIR